MIRLKETNQVVLSANALYPETFEDLRRNYSIHLPQGSFLPYVHPIIDISKLDRDPNYELSKNLVKHAFELISPDVILYPSVFEDWGQRGVVPLPQQGYPTALCAAIVYDFIPYRFSDKFLDPFPVFKEGYLRRLEYHKNFDLLLAISESTRLDAIQLFDLDPEKVVNISGAANKIFRKVEYSTEQVSQLFSRLKINKPFIFYTGNAEYHKNMEKMLEAFSELPSELIHNHQVVLTHTGDENLFRTRLRSLGLSNEKVVITGHITDNELVMLYNLCKLFIFPSLYEGFGLPILEAMACGAPVIASNNSSIPEVIGRTDAMFNASDRKSITQALYQTLTDASFRCNLSEYGLERVRQFSWEKTAQKSWNAINHAILRKKRQFWHLAIQKKQKKSLIALVVADLDRQDSISGELFSLLLLLREEFEIDLYVQPEIAAAKTDLNLSNLVLPWTKFLERCYKYQTVVYMVNMFDPNDQLITFLREVPGVVVLIAKTHYQINLTSAESSPNLWINDQKFKRDLGSEFGLKGLIEYIHVGKQQIKGRLPILSPFLKYAQEIIVTSDYHSDLLNHLIGKERIPKVNVINFLDFVTDIERNRVFGKDTYDYIDHLTKQIKAVLIHAIQKNEHRFFASMIDTMIVNKMPKEDIKLAARIAGANYNLRNLPRLLIDVSYFSKWDLSSSIQHVVNDVIRELMGIEEPAFRIDLVKIVDGKLILAYRSAEKILNLPENSLGDEIAVEIRNGDYLYMLDSSWQLYDQFLPIFDQIRIHGGRIYTMIFDMSPIHFPETFAKSILDIFNYWIDIAITQSDCLICISKAVAVEVENYLRNKSGVINHSPDLSIVNLESDDSSPSSGDGLYDDFVVRLRATMQGYS